MATSRPRYRWAVAVYDRVYQLVHGLDRPAAEVGAALRVEIRRSHRVLALGDGTVVHRGDRIAVLHLNNARIAELHTDGLSPIEVGLEFRRRLFASLQELARLAAAGGPLAGVRAFCATTIFYRRLARIGFDAEAGGMTWPWLVATYQRALLASLHPSGVRRLGRTTDDVARRVWISRELLLRRFGGPGALRAS